jgi:WD40 repeat protein
MLAMPTWDGGIYLQDLTTPRIPGPALHGHEAWVWSVAFSPDDRWLASGGKDTQVRLWILRDPLAPAIVLGSHNDQVTRVRFSPDGKLLASAGVDFSVRLWNVENPDALPIVLSGHEGEVWGLAYSPDGKTLASAGADISSGNNNTILLWDLTHPLNSSTTESVANSVCPKVLRNLTLDEWHQFVGEDIPYERTCPNRPIHPSLFETAEKLAREGDKAGAIALLERAIELEPELDLKPQEEVERWTMSAEQ